MFPPTVFIVHRNERRSKCSIEPLRGQPGFVFRSFPATAGATDPALASYVRLGVGGPALTPADAERGLLLLDGSWRWAEVMERAYQDIPVRGLWPWTTAYPRKSKVFADPAAGLATIEALFAAYHQLGRPTGGLLDSYHWREAFLEQNRERLRPPTLLMGNWTV